jgi:nucleotide-binding universal stress UspA family protein
MRILLPVDGSPNSLRAATVLPHLQSLEEVILLYVLDLPSLAYPIGRPEVDLAIPLQVEQALREDGERILARAAEQLPAKAGSVRKRLETGSAPSVIVEIAEREGVDLVILGARGLSGLQEALLGSVSHAVAAHAPSPVLLVRDAVQSVGHALAAVQDADDAHTVVRFLAKTPFQHPPEVTLVHVLPFHDPLWPGGLSDARAHREKAEYHAREFLSGVVRELVAARIPATSRVLAGRPQAVLLEELKSGRYELAMVGPRRKGPAKRLFLGSVSSAVVHHTAFPVLVLR